MNRTTLLSLDKYGISRKRYKELCGFCEQYPEWKKEIADYSYIKPLKNGEVHGSGVSDPTFDAAVKMERFITNCKVIEDTARETDGDCWEFLIKNICYEVPIDYMITYEHMPMSKRTFFYRRREFFFRLDRKK